MGLTNVPSALLAALVSTFARRVTRDQPTRIVFLPNEAVLSRLTLVEEVAASRPGTGASPRWDWQPISRISRVLYGPVSAELGLILGLADWRAASVSIQSALACLAVKDLAEKMDANLLCEISDCNEDVLKAHGQCAAILHRGEQMVEDALDRLSRAIAQTRNDPSGQASTALQLEADGGEIRVAYLNQREERVFQESLTDFLQRVASRSLKTFFDAALEFRERLPHYRALGSDLLRKICPAVVAVAQRAAAGDRVFGFRMFRGVCRGFPAEILLFFAPAEVTPGAHGVHLIARRAHSEFILENERQPPEWYWFPPAQIQARLTFVPDQRIWVAASPEIRMPKGALGVFVHPYIGHLEDDPFSRMRILNDDGVELATPVSDVAQGLFGPTLRPAGVARLRDMCLAGQETCVAQLDAVARETALRSGRVEVFNVIQGIWQLARQGLCRAHQENDSRPRISLSADSMPYPILDRTAVKSSALSARVFHYHG